MENKKRTIILLLCFVFAFSPLVTLGSFSYADNPSAGGGGGGASDWINISTDEQLVAAFKAYCKSRNFDITHVPNTVKAIVKWDYEQLQRAAALANVDLTTLNAKIWYAYENSGYLKFWFDKSALTALSGLYAAILNENDVGNNESKGIYSGRYFQGPNGITDGAYCYETYLTGTSSNYNNFTKVGTRYLYSSLWVWENRPSSLPFNFNNNQGTINLNVNYEVNGTRERVTLNNKTGAYLRYHADNGSAICDYGGTIIIYNTHSEKYFLGTLCHNQLLEKDSTQFKINFNVYEIVDATFDNSNITYNQGDETTPPENKNLSITTNNTTINNYITNDNDTITYNYTDDNPTIPPVYTDPYDNNSTGGTINPDGSINFQMPDLNINWHLNLNENDLPFPFSIPFDMINFFSAFHSEPVAPHIQENVTIANMTIPIDIDLEWLDDVAGYFRTFVLLIYIFGLIIATRALFHIY